MFVFPKNLANLLILIIFYQLPIKIKKACKFLSRVCLMDEILTSVIFSVLFDLCMSSLEV